LRHSRHFTLGVVFLLIGLAMLGVTMGWIPPFPAALFAQGWPLALIVVGLWLVARGWSRPAANGHTGLLLGMVLVAVGTAKWGSYNHLWPEKVFWPFVFIGLGLGFLLREIHP